MRFSYKNEIYDVRLKSRYLPKGIKQIAGDDLALLTSRFVFTETKQAILDSYLDNAVVVA
jgi:hypothetical protein